MLIRLSAIFTPASVPTVLGFMVPPVNVAPAEVNVAEVRDGKLLCVEDPVIDTPVPNVILPLKTLTPVTVNLDAVNMGVAEVYVNLAISFPATETPSAATLES